MNQVGTLKVTIVKAVLSKSTQHLVVVRPYVQFKFREFESRTQSLTTPLTGGINNFALFNQTFKVTTLSQEDELVFQLKEDGQNEYSNHDNILGECKMQLKDLSTDFGQEKWIKLYYNGRQDGKPEHLEGCQLSIITSFQTAKSEDSKFTPEQHAINAELQEKYVAQQRKNLEEAKLDITKMTEQMKQFGLPKMPEVPQKAGRQWPLSKDYIQKVEKSKPKDLVSEALTYNIDHKNYDGLKNQNKINSTITQENNWQGIQAGKSLNTSAYTKKPEKIIGKKNLAFKTTTDMINKDKKDLHLENFGAKQGGNNKGDIGYAIGTQDQLNIKI